MAITTLDGWIASGKQQITMAKVPTTGRTTVAGVPFSVFDLAGQPGAGTLAGTNTANGLVPTDATAGCPLINAFGGGATGYLSSIMATSNAASRIMLFDMLFKAGAYSFNSNVTLTAQPSYSGRIPGGTDYTNTEIWLETVTAFTGNLSVTVTYTNEAGTTARTTGAYAPALAPTLGRMFRLPLQAGDIGVQKIESVVSTTATIGTFNVLVLRRLASLRVQNSGSNAMDLSTLGMPQVFADSALYWNIATDGTNSGSNEVFLTIVNG